MIFNVVNPAEGGILLRTENVLCPDRLRLKQSFFALISSSQYLTATVFSRNIILLSDHTHYDKCLSPFIVSTSETDEEDDNNLSNYSEFYQFIIYFLKKEINISKNILTFYNIFFLVTSKFFGETYLKTFFKKDVS